VVIPVTHAVGVAASNISQRRSTPQYLMGCSCGSVVDDAHTAPGQVTASSASGKGDKRYR